MAVWGRRASAACTAVGAACLWAWGYTANLSTALFPVADVVDSIGIEFAYYTSQLTLAVLALAVALVLRRRHRGLPPAAVVGSGVALGAASALVSLLMRVPGAPVAAVMACGVVYGAAAFVLTVAWGARFSLGSRATRRVVLLSFLLGYAIYLGSLNLSGGVATALACALPVVSALLWLLDSWRRHLLTAEVWPARPTVHAGADVSLLGEASAGSVDSGLLPWRTIGLFAVTALVGNFVSSFLMGSTYQGAAVIFPGAFLVCFCITLAALVLLGTGEARLSAERLYRYCLPFAVLGMLLLIVLPGGGASLSGSLVVGASMFLQVVVVLKVTEATQETGISPLLSFGVGQGLVGGVVFLGNVLGRTASGLPGGLPSGVPGAEETWLPAVCAAGVFILFYLLVMATDDLAARLLTTDGDGACREGDADGASETTCAMTAGGAATPGTTSGAAHGVGRIASDADLLNTFADRHGLTPREAQVCAYLVQGRSLPFIAEQLYVTAGTAKTHALHIYRKAGVGSKQELISLYEREIKRESAEG